MERPFAVWSYKDAEMRQLEYRYSMAVARGNLEEAEHYQQIIDNLKKRYAKTDAFLARFAEPLIGGEYSRNYLLSFAPKRLTQLECHDAAVRAFQAKCMPHIAGTAYAVRYASLMAHICERRVPVEAILARIDEFC